jgi:hypothetical protein
VNKTNHINGLCIDLFGEGLVRCCNVFYEQIERMSFNLKQKDTIKLTTYNYLFVFEIRKRVHRKVINRHTFADPLYELFFGHNGF